MVYIALFVSKGRDLGFILCCLFPWVGARVSTFKGKLQVNIIKYDDVFFKIKKNYKV